jgi:DNA ligase (NAD+)
LVGKVIHYASREALNIEGLGEETVKQMVNREMVREIADLYRLSVKQLETLEGFASKSAKKLHNSIQKSKTVRFDKFLYALGIRHIGEHIAQVLAREFESIDAIENADLEDLRKIPEVGPEIANSIVNFFEQNENRQALQHLFDAGIKIEKMPTKKRSKLSLRGKTFVFTGELENYTRSEAKEEIEKLGARATSSVSSNTDYVVVGEDPGSKLNEAEARKITIINENEFEKILHS